MCQDRAVARVQALLGFRIGPVLRLARAPAEMPNAPTWRWAGTTTAQAMASPFGARASRRLQRVLGVSDFDALSLNERDAG